MLGFTAVSTKLVHGKDSSGSDSKQRLRLAVAEVAAATAAVQ